MASVRGPGLGPDSDQDARLLVGESRVTPGRRKFATDVRVWMAITLGVLATVSTGVPVEAALKDVVPVAFAIAAAAICGLGAAVVAAIGVMAGLKPKA